MPEIVNKIAVKHNTSLHCPQPHDSKGDMKTVSFLMITSSFTNINAILIVVVCDFQKGSSRVSASVLYLVETTVSSAI